MPICPPLSLVRKVPNSAAPSARTGTPTISAASHTSTVNSAANQTPASTASGQAMTA